MNLSIFIPAVLIATAPIVALMTLGFIARLLAPSTGLRMLKALPATSLLAGLSFFRGRCNA